MTLELKSCPICGIRLTAELYDQHVEGCAAFEEREKILAQRAKEERDDILFFRFFAPGWIYRKLSRFLRDHPVSEQL